jgi:hypothetical protein
LPHAANVLLIYGSKMVVFAPCEQTRRLSAIYA